MFPNLETFRQVFTQVTNDYGCLVIVNRGSRATFLEKVFWYKADETKEVKMGSKQFRKFHDNNYNPDWKTKKKPFDLSKFVGKKREY